VLTCCAARDGEASDHGDDPDLQWALHEILAANAITDEELPGPPRSSTARIRT